MIVEIYLQNKEFFQEYFPPLAMDGSIAVGSESKVCFCTLIVKLSLIESILVLNWLMVLMFVALMVDAEDVQ